MLACGWQILLPHRKLAASLPLPVAGQSRVSVGLPLDTLRIRRMTAERPGLISLPRRARGARVLLCTLLAASSTDWPFCTSISCFSRHTHALCCSPLWSFRLASISPYLGSPIHLQQQQRRRRQPRTPDRRLCPSFSLTSTPRRLLPFYAIAGPHPLRSRRPYPGKGDGSHPTLSPVTQRRYTPRQVVISTPQQSTETWYKSPQISRR